MSRPDGRLSDQLRPVSFTPGYTDYAEGSVLVTMGAPGHTGGTRVLCNASVENKVPPWLLGRGQGWLTAEYSLLPRSTHTRTPRETTPSGRTQEIRRLIGRIPWSVREPVLLLSLDLDPLISHRVC